MFSGWVEVISKGTKRLFRPLEYAFLHSASTNPIKIPSARLDDFIGQNQSFLPVLIKIDTQEDEDLAIPDAGKSLHKLDCIGSEISFQLFNKKQTLFRKIYHLLNNSELHFTEFMNSTISSNDGSIMQSNVIFS